MTIFLSSRLLFFRHVHTTPENFGNGVFTLKGMNFFFSLVSEESSGREITWVSAVTSSFLKSTIFKMCFVHAEMQKRCFQILPV